VKNGLILCLMLMCSSLFAAAPANNRMTLKCSFYRTSVGEHYKKCPQLIEKVLENMECGGKVESCMRTSPGSPNSTLDCKVVKTSCVLPTKNDYSEGLCKRTATKKYFRDYDFTEAYDSNISTNIIEGVITYIPFLCQPAKKY
jgi:hypothetical protein